MAKKAGLALVCVLYFLLSIFPTQSEDVFMYLALGREYFKNGHFPVRDPFLFTLPGYPWEILHEWGSYVLTYFLYDHGGWPLLTVSKALLVCVVPLTAIWISRKLKAAPWVSIALLLLAGVAACSRFIERGSLISDVLIQLTIAILLVERRTPGKACYFLPLLFIAWVNLHPGFLVGLAACFCALIAESKHWRKRELRVLAACVGASAVGCLANPKGLAGALYPLTFMFRTGSDVLKQYFIEWLPTLSSRFSQEAGVQALLVMLAGVGLLLLFSLWLSRKKPVFEMLCFALIAYLGLSAIRFVSTAAFALIPLGIALSAELRFGEGELWPKRILIGEVALCALCILKVGFLGYQTPEGHRKPGFGIDPQSAPLVAAEKFQQLVPTGNFYNSHSIGAYLAWKWGGARKIFIHGFATDYDFYYNDFLGAQRSPEGFKRVVDRYDLKALFLDRYEGNMDGFAQAVVQTGGWKLAYEDKTYLILIRDPAGAAP